MPYTKTPDFNTHQIKRVPIGGSPYHGNLNTGNLTTQTPQYTNCFPLQVEQLNNNPQIYVVPRYVESNTVVWNSTTSSAAQCRGFFPWGGSVWGNTYVNSGSTFAVVGTVTDYVNQVYGDTLIFGTTQTQFFIVSPDSGANSTLYWSTDFWVTQNTVALSFVATGRPVVIDGYVFIIGGFQRIFNCALGDITTWPLTNYLDAEQFPDGLITLGKHKNYLVAFGNNSMEFFYDAGTELGSPLQRQESLAKKIGTLQPLPLHFVNSAADNLIYIGDDLYFLGYDPTIQAFNVYVLSKSQVTPISSPYINSLLTNSCQFMAMTMRDTPIVIIRLGTIYVGYIPQSKAWINLTWNTVYSFIGPFCYWRSNGTATINQTQLVSQPTGTNDIDFFANYQTELIDFDSQNMKQWKWCDVVGDFNPLASTVPTIALNYTNKDSYFNYVPTTTQTQQNVGSPVRFRNLGPGRKMSFKINIFGRYGWRLDGIEVAYNIGQY